LQCFITMAEEQPEEVKVEARQFMADVLSTAAEQSITTDGKSIDMTAWKATYRNKIDNDPAGLMEQFWSIYDPHGSSIWKIVYDEADSNENLDETIEIVTALMQKTRAGSDALEGHCFGVVYTLENLEIEGLWIFNGPDPAQLFGINEDTSWFSWSQLGPDANELVKKVVASLMTPKDGTLNGKRIEDTQVFSCSGAPQCPPMSSSQGKPYWVPPEESYHAHFDCFSGAAGDMMLAACLNAAEELKLNGCQQLMQYISHSLEEGMPELKGEFTISAKQVWRGMGSIAACYVNVESKYYHAAAPPPERSASSADVNATVEHNHSEQNHNHGHSHGHQHEHEHQHGHGHDHTFSNAAEETLPPHEHTHAHINLHELQPSANHHSHSHSHVHDSSNSKGPLRNLPQICTMLKEAPTEYIPEWVKDTAIAAFTALAHAEAKTHGAASIDAVHFHEVGAVDSIVDTVGTLLALHALSVTSVSCSRLPLGEGSVWTDHGLLPVPAPATLQLMVNMPTCSGPAGTTGELVTPTAAALLKVLVESSSATTGSIGVDGRPPNFTIRFIGTGAGTKDFEKHPNVLRLMLGNNIVKK